MDIAELIALGQMEKGKVSINDPSGKVHKDIAEAEAIQRHEADRNARRAANNAKLAALNASGKAAETSRMKFGTNDPATIRKADVPGNPISDPDAFKLLASAHPEEATRVLDTVGSALGITGGSQAPAAEFRKGTQTTPDGRQIPYFTNLQGDAGVSGGPMAGVTGLEHYNAGNIERGDAWADSTDPAKRGVAREMTNARSMIENSPKTQDAIGRDVAARFPSALKDVTELGEEGARAKWLKDVEAGKMSYPTMQHLGVQTGEEAARQDEAKYESTRQKYFEWARGRGVVGALQTLSEHAQSGTLDPKYAARIERDLIEKAKSREDPEADLAPDAFLPYTVADAANWRWSTPRPDKIEDPSKPPTLLNPGGLAPGPEERMQKRVELSGATLLDTISGPEATGAPARTMDSYTVKGGATPRDAGPRSGAGWQFGGSFWDAGPSAGEQMGTGPMGVLTGAGEAIGEATQGLSHAAGGRESPAERKRRLAKEAARRARG